MKLFVLNFNNAIKNVIFCKGAWAISFTAFALLIITCFLEGFLNRKAHKQTKLTIYINLILCVSCTLFCLVDYFYFKQVFNVVENVVCYLFFTFIIISLLKSVFSFVAPKKRQIVFYKKVTSVSPKPFVEKKVENIVCVNEKASVYSGYLDTSYLKSLIDSLKEKGLTPFEQESLTRLEVYLMNFAVRQPTAEERKVLSGQIGELIKTLAKYNAI